MTRFCDTCRHWQSREIHTGECRRYPPSGFNTFPTTQRNAWCGEHRTLQESEA